MLPTTRLPPPAIKSHTWLWASVPVAALSVGLYWAHRAESVDVESLRDIDRQALFVRTEETLRGVCANPNRSGLDDFCEEQARFILRFPECRTECRLLSHRFTPRPTR